MRWESLVTRARGPEAAIRSAHGARFLGALLAWSSVLVAVAIGVRTLSLVDPSVEQVAMPPDSIPPAVIRAAKLRYPDGIVTAANASRSSGATSYELAITSGGKQFVAALAPTGEWREVELAMAPSQLPAVVRRALNASAQAGWPVRSVEVVRPAGEKTLEFYEVNVERRGTTLELLYRTDGRRVRARLARG